MVEDLNLVIESLQAELKELCDRHAAILKKTLAVRQAIEGLAELFGPGVIDDELRHLLWPHRRVSRRNLGRLCRRLLGTRRRPLQVRDLLKLIDKEYPGTLRHVRDPDRYLRSALALLVSAREVVEERAESGLVAWRAVSLEAERNAEEAASVLAEVPEPRQKIKRLRFR